MRISKRIISVLLCVLLVMSVLSVSITTSAATATGTSGGTNWSFEADTGVLTISKADDGNGRVADYANSSTKRAPWYSRYRTAITSVVVESGVIQLGSYSFYNCTNLKTVTLANTVDTIGECCFRSCSSLENFTFPENCTYLWKEAFLSCTGLKWVRLPRTSDAYSNKIPDGTFSGCTSLEEVYVGTGFNAIDTKAFYNCTSLKGIMWGSGNIESVGTNGLYGVPSSCKFVSSSSLSSWCGNNGYAFVQNSGSCSGSSLSYDINLSTRDISFSGKGDMISNPWSCVHYLLNGVDFTGTNGAYSVMQNAFKGAGIDHVVFSDTQPLTIYSYAFADCNRSTYWLNFPESTVMIASQAFANTNFNYVTCAADSISIADDAFTNGGYARFFGKSGSGLREMVEYGKAQGYARFYYCYGDTHNLTRTVVDPTCTEQGYSVLSCPNCDLDNSYSEYVPALGHMYEHTGNQNEDFLYRCKRCGETDLHIDAFTVYSMFEDRISHDNDNSAFNQSNYDGAVDVFLDGYINAKDFALIGKTLMLADATNKATVINESIRYQTIEGFGASACWWSQEAGTWDNIDTIMKMLYDDEEGIGLDIYRYNLGAGTQDDAGLYNVGTRARCFLQADGTYNWNNDPGAMSALEAARRANPDLKLTLFCNSPPIYMTINGKGYVNPKATDDEANEIPNLDETNYQAFTDYVITCAEHFTDEGYNVTELSPINEPEWGWRGWYNGDGSISCGQEGCHYDPVDAAVFYNNYFIPSVQRSSKLNGIDVSVWECAQLNHNWWWNRFLNNLFSSDSAYSSKNANIRNYVDVLDTHSYWASKADREAVKAQLGSSQYSSIKRIKCSEYCQMLNDGSSGVYDKIQEEGATNGMTIDYGIALADIMYQDLTILNAVEWDWWTACGYGIYPDSLIYFDRNDHTNLMPSKRYYTMGNYSKFIDVGAQRVSCSAESGLPATVEQSAYRNPDGSVVVVYINKGTSNQYTSFDSSKYASLETYVTDESRGLKKLQHGSVDGSAVLIPARSVTTVVLSK